MMRSESTSALGQPSETNEIFGVGAFMRLFASERSAAGLGGANGFQAHEHGESGATALPLMALQGHKWQKPGEGLNREADRACDSEVARWRPQNPPTISTVPFCTCFSRRC
jgi:hypothetical protein